MTVPRRISSYALLALLSAATGVTSVFVTGNLLAAAHHGRGGNAGGAACRGERCCYICDRNAGQPACTAVAWDNEGDFHDYCTTQSYDMGAGGTYYATMGGCQAAAQCRRNAGRPTCMDGEDNDLDRLIDQDDPDCADGNSNETTPNNVVDLLIRASGPETVQAGQTVTYTIVLQNLSSNGGGSSEVYGSFGSHLTYVSHNSEPACTVNGQNGTFTCSAGLVPLASETISFTFVVRQNTAVCNTPSRVFDVSIQSTGAYESNYNNNRASVDTVLYCPECMDGIDNDGNGYWDFPYDQGCTSDTDTSERQEDAALPECTDGLDNDGDGLVDGYDPGCSQGNSEALATTACQDGMDNDGDGAIDLSDPDCQDALDNRESTTGQEERQQGNRGAGAAPEQQGPPSGTLPAPGAGNAQGQQGVPVQPGQQPAETPAPGTLPAPGAGNAQGQQGVPVQSGRQPAEVLEQQERQRVEQLQRTLQERQIRQAVDSRQLENLPTNATQARLGCFTALGQWTTDRTLCDANQERHIQRGQSAEAPPREVLEAALTERFVGNERYNQLLSSLHDIRDRLMVLQDTEALPERDTAFLEQSLSWVNGSIAFLTSRQHTVHDLGRIAGELRTVAESLEQRLVPVRSQQPDVTRIMQQIGSLLGKSYLTFQVLFRESIYVDTEIISDYQRASALFIDVQSRCYSNRSACGELREIVDILDTMLGSLQQMVREKAGSDVEAEIESIFAG